MMFKKILSMSLDKIHWHKNLFSHFLFGAMLLITVVAICVPLSPAMPGEGLDASYSFGLNQAYAQNLIFGRDIVFTFGPYSSLYSREYHPSTDTLIIASSIFLSVAIFLAIFLNFYKSSLLIKVFILLVLSGIVKSPREALLFFYPLLLAALVYKDKLGSSIGSYNKIQPSVIMALLFSPIGLLPLVKGSLIIASVSIVFFSGLLLWIERKKHLLIIAILSPIVSCLFFWILSGQPFDAISEYFIGMVPIIGGYTEAMSWPGDIGEVIFYLVASLFLVIILYFGIDGSFFNRFILTTIFVIIHLLAFKAGFVRHDIHAVAAANFLLLSTLLVGTLVSSKTYKLMAILCVFVWAYIDSSHKKTSTLNLIEQTTATYVNAYRGVRTRFVSPNRLLEQFDKSLDAINKRCSVLTLEGSVDIYSYEQSCLIAAKNKWNPRPTFQSYSVYTDRLAEYNYNHLVSSNRPDNIVFKIQPIDGRLPSLDDGISWLPLITNYENIGIYNNFFYLKHRRPGGEVALKNLSESSFPSNFNQKILLPDTPGFVFAKIDIQNSLIGKLFNTFFKPSSIEIKLFMKNGETKIYKFIPGMAKSGFVISPLVEDTTDFSNLHSGFDLINENVVAAFEINPVSLPFLWNPAFGVELISFVRD